MNLLVTLDSGYIKVLSVMLKSVLMSNEDTDFTVYMLNSTLTKEDFDEVKNYLKTDRMTLVDLKAPENFLEGAPISNRYPKEMYYRIFAARFLPKEVDRVLYLDPDLIVRKSLKPLYEMDMGDNYFAAATHVGKILTGINAIRLEMEDEAPYINSGVMLMNIALLRQEQNFKSVYDYINEKKNLLFLPDQDVISAVYGDRIAKIDSYVYNMNDRLLLSPKCIKKGITADWVAENSTVIHYLGRNKPWKDSYVGLLGYMYHDVVNAPLPQ